MKTLKNRITVFATSIIILMSCQAQDSITGVIENYSNNEGTLTNYDMITGDIISFGTIDLEGKFTIPLKEDFLEVMLAKAKKAQENAPKGSTISFKTVATTFICDFNNENIEYLDDGTEKVTYTGSNKKNEILYEKGEAIITGIPDLYLTDKNQVSSILYAVSKPEIANWLFSYRQDALVKGYYLQWYFVEDEASAIGACVIPTYTGNGEENYINSTIVNLKLKKGWNIIKYDITEIFTDLNGKTYASKTEITSLVTTPNDVKWVRVIEK